MVVLGTVVLSRISIAGLILVGLALVSVVGTLIVGARHMLQGRKMSRFEPDAQQALAWKGWLT